MSKRFRVREKSTKGRGVIIAAVVAGVIALAGVGVVALFQTDEITVTGNSFYTEQEIIDQVVTDTLCTNSLYLYVKYNFLGYEEIPFTDKISVSLNAPGKVSIRVYEKSIVGYASYLGSNFYFDRDGTVVESSTEVKDGVPCITGLEFTALTLYKQLEVEDDSVFDTILTVTQLLEKYELSPDCIEFEDDSSVNLYFDEVVVALGNSGSMEEKIGRLFDVYGDLVGLSGTFHMENYTADSKYISFEQG